MNKTNILRLFFLLLFSAMVFGQSTPSSFSLNKISGMPSDMVFDVLQDQQGFMWFATSKGICRYDGLQVKTYTSADSSVKSVSNIRQDSAGRIWFQDFNGNIFFINKDKAEIFKPYKANGFLKFGFIKNQLYVAGKDGIKIFDIKNFKLLKHISFNLKTTKQTLITKDRFYLIGEEISYLDSEGKINKINLPENYTEKIQAPIATAQGNEVFIISKFNDNYLKITQNKITQHQFPFKSIFTQNANIINNELWLCSTKGIYRYNLNNTQYQVFFPNTNISYIAKTNIGKHWISTMNNGVLYVEDFQSDFIETPSVPLRMVNKGNDILFSTNQEEIFRMDQNKNISKIYQGTSDHHIAPLFVDELNNRLLFTSSKFIIKSPKKTAGKYLGSKKNHTTRCQILHHKCKHLERNHFHRSTSKKRMG